MLSALLVELDGVLVDPAPERAASLAAAFAAEGARWPVATDVPALRAVDWRAPFDTLAATVVALQARTGDTEARTLDDTALALVALRAERDYAARLAAGVTLVHGARAAVEALAAALRVGVVTSWRRADAERVLSLAGLDASVRFVVAADDSPRVRDEADRVTAALTRLRGRGDARATGALLAGPAGIAAARAAGARTVPNAEVGGTLRDLTPARLAALLDSALPASPSDPPR